MSNIPTRHKYIFVTLKLLRDFHFGFNTGYNIVKGVNFANLQQFKDILKNETIDCTCSYNFEKTNFTIE